jgi:bifunctional DNA-binding transcriptional regulator/antitoxin component of YhaV-PrlF toxin-antitoxin module
MVPAVAEQRMEAARVDSKGRVMLPRRTRRQVELNPGDLVLVAVEPGSKAVRIVKAVTPFDVLAVEAIALDNKGQTIGDEELVARLGLDPDAEPFEIDDTPA